MAKIRSTTELGLNPRLDVQNAQAGQGRLTWSSPRAIIIAASCSDAAPTSRKRPSRTSPPRNSATPRRLDYGDLDLRHAHHRIKRALCFIAAGRQRLGQHTWRDLPRHAPLVFAPAARTLLAAIADDSVPIAVGLGLIVSGDLEREGFAMFERGTAVEADTRDAGNFEFDCQHISLLAEWVVTGCTEDGTHRAVGKGLGIKASSGLGIFIVPEAKRVLCHCMSFRFEARHNPHPLLSR